jgi:hypothetical protein
VVSTVDADAWLYRLVQFAIREAVASRTLDEVLSAKNALDAELRAFVRERVAAAGLEVTELGVKERGRRAIGAPLICPNLSFVIASEAKQSRFTWSCARTEDCFVARLLAMTTTSTARSAPWRPRGRVLCPRG